MAYLLNVVYCLLLLLASPLLAYAAWRKGKYREGYGQKLCGHVPLRASRQPGIWLHAVSVGEVNLLAPLLAQIAAERPECECAVSTTTKTGYELARGRYPHLSVFYCPLDFTWAVSRAMRRMRPDLLVLTELELWPNLIRAASDSGAAVAVINGRLSSRSYRGYRRLKWLLAPTFARLDAALAQNETYAGRFLQLGVPAEAIQVTGSMKFDGAQQRRDNTHTQYLRKLARFDEGAIVFLAGSTQTPEESMAIDTFLALRDRHPDLRLVLVPRHPQRFDQVAALLQRRQLRFLRRSQLEVSKNPADIILVDTVGELGGWWGTATIGLVGGSFGKRGGQNMIEPAAYGVATCFGPRTQNFRDVVAALLAADAAQVVSSGEELTCFVARCLEEPGFVSNLGSRAQQLVASQQGATRATYEVLSQLVLDRTRGKIPFARRGTAA